MVDEDTIERALRNQEIAEQYRSALTDLQIPAIKKLANIPNPLPAETIVTRVARQVSRVAPIPRLATTFQSPLLSRMREVAGHLSDALEQYRSDKEAFDPVIVELGWPPPREIPLPAMRAILRTYENNDLEEARREVNHFLVEYYDDEVLGRIATRWMDTGWIEDRHPILREILNGYKEGYYSLVITCAFAQTDGILAESFDHEGQLSGSDYKAYVKDLFSSDQWFHDQSAVKEFVFKYTRAQFEFGKPLGSDLSRHAIMHGGDTEYGCQENALKLILLLDYIIDSAQFFATPQGDCYHERECGQLDRSDATLRVFKTDTDAEAADLRPCSFCSTAD